MSDKKEPDSLLSPKRLGEGAVYFIFGVVATGGALTIKHEKELATTRQTLAVQSVAINDIQATIKSILTTQGEFAVQMQKIISLTEENSRNIARVENQ